MNSIGFLALLLVTSVALDTGMYARIEQASLRSSHDLGVKMNVRFIVKVVCAEDFLFKCLSAKISRTATIIPVLHRAPLASNFRDSKN